MTSPIKIAVTGAAGQIGYSLVIRIASGAMFGPEQPIALSLIEIPNALGALEGVVMELHDCAFPLLKSVTPKAQLAYKAGVEVTTVTKMTIWGNHSATQYPDFYNAKINGRAANEVIGDEKWLKETFIQTVQQRGAAIIKARGLSSAASAANAVVDTVRSLITDTPKEDWHSVALCSTGEYGVENGLICSFPVQVKNGRAQVVQNV